MDIEIEQTVKTLNPKLMAESAFMTLLLPLTYSTKKSLSLREENKEIMLSRLALVKSLGITMKNILSVLGISALDRM